MIVLNTDKIIALGFVSIMVTLLFVLVFVGLFEKSNTGVLIPKSINKRYIDVDPKEDYLTLLKKDEKIWNNLSINSYPIKIALDNQYTDDFIKMLNDRYDTVKLMNFALKKASERINGDNIYNKILYVINVRVINPENVPESGKYAGGTFDRRDNTLTMNYGFIKGMYGQTNQFDFDMYYIGLFIHECSHFLMEKRIGPNKPTEEMLRIEENLCEYVRFSSGYYMKSKMFLKKSNKSRPTEDYGAEAGFFMYWLGKNHPGILKQLFLFSKGRFKENLDEFYIRNVGKTEVQLFSEFQQLL
jgi:hypothetical protein